MVAFENFAGVSSTPRILGFSQTTRVKFIPCHHLDFVDIPDENMHGIPAQRCLKFFSDSWFF